jgi:hypothetical protein
MVAPRQLPWLENISLQKILQVQCEAYVGCYGRRRKIASLSTKLKIMLLLIRWISNALPAGAGWRLIQIREQLVREFRENAKRGGLLRWSRVLRQSRTPTWRRQLEQIGTSPILCFPQRKHLVILLLLDYGYCTFALVWQFSKSTILASDDNMDCLSVNGSTILKLDGNVRNIFTVFTLIDKKCPYYHPMIIWTVFEDTC